MNGERLIFDCDFQKYYKTVAAIVPPKSKSLLKIVTQNGSFHGFHAFHVWKSKTEIPNDLWAC